jgi:AcrR family transcriptional regulator
MELAADRPPRNAVETKARILAAAQTAFSERGYSQTGMRDIAERACVAHSLILRYFGTKANLFAEALTASFADSSFPGATKPNFGQRVVEGIDNPEVNIISPGMITLALGDDEARKIAATVLASQTINRVSTWLGGPNAEVRATNLMIMAMGYAIFSRLLDLKVSEATRRGTADWMADAMQDLVDATQVSVATRRGKTSI